jgi:micrococcal nuclease
MEKIMENKKNLPRTFQSALPFRQKGFLLIIFLGFLAILFALLGLDFYPDKLYFSENHSEAQEVKVQEIIDGDTIRVENIDTKETFAVRYLGIDAPELDGPIYETCFSEQAKSENEELVLDQNLLLEFDMDKYDRFGRTLAYVYTADESGEKDVFINLELLENGYARFYLDKQNTLYQQEFVEAALIAQQEFSGLWGECGEDIFDRNCLIKGNVSFEGKSGKYGKYYHLPGDKHYSLTSVNLLKEDQWLSTIE